MNSIEIVNMKCSGCANTIKLELEKIGVKEINVDIENQIVNFDGDENLVEEKLLQLGYPKKGSEKAKSFLKNATSYVSCAIGKIRK